jgi:hypothetical protein
MVSDFRLVFVFFGRMWKNNVYTIRACEQVMEQLVAEGVDEIAVYCTGYVARILHLLSKDMPFRLSNIYDKAWAGKRFLGHEVLPLDDLRGYEGKVAIASLVGIIEKSAELEELGVSQDDIVRLQ